MNLSTLEMLENAVQKSFVVVDMADTKRILDEGFEAVSNEFTFAFDHLNESDMLRLKDGGNIFDSALACYNRISKATSEMIAAKEMRNADLIRYALLTGHDLESKVHHDADLFIKVRKAIIKGQYVTLPLIKEAQQKREVAFSNKEVFEAKLNILLQKVKALPAKEQDKLKGIVDDSLLELDNLKIELLELEADVIELIEESKELVKEYAFSFDEKGKRVYNKDSERNKWYSSILREGRTAITEFKTKHAKIYGVDKVVNLSELDKASKVLGL